MGMINEYSPNLEIYFSGTVLDTLSFKEVLELKDRLDYLPSVTFHAPFMDLSPGAADAKIRAVTAERFSHIFDVAEILNPKAIVFHSGYEKWRFGLKSERWLTESLKTWQPFLKRASETGTKIAIENIFEDEPSNLKDLAESLNSPNFGLCFDTGHFNLFSKISLKDWLDMTADYIIELHLHDNDKTYDAHLPIGEGTFNFQELFSYLKSKDLIYTIEAHNPERVLKSMQNLSQFLSGD